MSEIEELIDHLETQKTTSAVDFLIAEIRRLRQEIKRLKDQL